jgi:hypothetical protein
MTTQEKAAAPMSDRAEERLSQLAARVPVDLCWTAADGAHENIPLGEIIRTLTAQLKEARERYEDLKDNRIEATEAIRAEYLGRYLAAESSLSSLRERVRPLVTELADDLESFVEGHYDRIKAHPAMTPKYERDMELVKRARVFLSTLPYDGEGK